MSSSASRRWLIIQLRKHHVKLEVERMLAPSQLSDHAPSTFHRRFIKISYGAVAKLATLLYNLANFAKGAQIENTSCLS
jgi:hypothetical protein